MKAQIVSVATASFILAFSAQAFAQSNTTDDSARQADRSGTFTHGESKRCEALSGAEREQCDRDEATKTEGSKPDTGETAASTGGTSQGNDSDKPSSGAGAPPPGMSAD